MLAKFNLNWILSLKILPLKVFWFCEMLVGVTFCLFAPRITWDCLLSGLKAEKGLTLAILADSDKKKKKKIPWILRRKAFGVVETKTRDQFLHVNSGAAARLQLLSWQVLQKAGLDEVNN